MCDWDCIRKPAIVWPAQRGAFSEELKDEWSVQIIVSFWACSHWRIPDDKALMASYSVPTKDQRCGHCFMELNAYLLFK